MFWSWTMQSINAYVTTAASGFEASWGTYCPPMDKINGVPMDTCLGDLYSINWMEDSDLTDLSGESLKEQFQRVKTETNMSHVHEFGSKTVKKEIVGNFQSTYDKGQNEDNASQEQAAHKPVDWEAEPTASDASVDAHDIDLVVAFYRYLRASAGESRRSLAADLMDQVREREAVDEVFSRVHELFSQHAGHPLQLSESAGDQDDSDCVAAASTIFERTCDGLEPVSKAIDDGSRRVGRGFSSYSIQYAGTLVDLCASTLSMDEVEAILRQACAAEGTANLREPHARVFSPTGFM
jgi:legumain